MREQPRWESELGSGSMIDAFRESLLRTAHRERARRIRRERPVWALSGVLAGVFAGYAYSRTSSVALIVFAFVLVAATTAGGLSAAFVGRDRLKWAAYHALMPIVAVGALLASYAVSDRWWLAVVVALPAWFLTASTLAYYVMPKPPER
jgi:hypothetical protein